MCPAAIETYAFDINDSGQIVGDFHTPGTFLDQSFVDTDCVLTTFNVPHFPTRLI